MLPIFSPLIVHNAVLKFRPCPNKPQLQLFSITGWYSIRMLLHHATDVVINRFRSGLLAGYMSGRMNWGVSHCRSLTVSRARCSGALWEEAILGVCPANWKALGVSCSIGMERDHLVLNNGIIARLLPPTSMLPTGHGLITLSPMKNLPALRPFVNILWPLVIRRYR